MRKSMVTLVEALELKLEEKARHGMLGCRQSSGHDVEVVAGKSPMPST